MFQNTILRANTSNGSRKFRAIFPKGRVLIAHLRMAQASLLNLLGLSNTYANHVAEIADAICISITPPKKKTDLAEWSTQLATVASSFLGRPLNERPVGIAVPAKYFELGFSAACMSRCQFVLFENCFDQGPTGPSRHQFQILREKERALVVLVSFSSALAKDNSLAMAGARAKALSDGMILYGESAKKLPSVCDLKINREAVQQFPVLLDLSSFRDELQHLPRIEGAIVAREIHNDRKALQRFLKQLNTTQMHLKELSVCPS